jgi:hypothetical protein
MTNSDRLILTVGLLLACGLLLLIAVLSPTLLRIMVGRTPTPDVVGTFKALVATGSPPPVLVTPPDLAQTPTFAVTALPGTAVPPPAAGSGPGGHIVFTCQIYQDISAEQICMMNSDGTDNHRITNQDNYRRYYPSLSPDGKSVVYSGYREENVYEIYELDLASGKSKQLTDRLGVLNAPEISPDGKSIVGASSKATAGIPPGRRTAARSCSPPTAMARSSCIWETPTARASSASAT